MDREELLKKLEDTDIEKVKVYLDVLDKIILQTLVARFLSNNEIENILQLWQKYIKSEINLESVSRNEFLMSTEWGRWLSQLKDFDDGESVRLKGLGAINVATDIARRNYVDPENNEEHF